RRGISLKAKVSEMADDDLQYLLRGAPAGRFPGLIKLMREWHDQGVSEDYREWLMRYQSPMQCDACKGQRLRPESLAVKFETLSIAELANLSIGRALAVTEATVLSDREKKIAGRILDEVRTRLGFLASVGLDYLSLDRSAATLSGGEAQRVRLATQIG